MVKFLLFQEFAVRFLFRVIIKVIHFNPKSFQIQILTMNNQNNFFRRWLNRIFTNPGVLYFFVVCFISYVTKNYNFANLFYFNDFYLFLFAVAWLDIFIIYNVLLAYIANSIQPCKDGTIRELNLPAYLPKFIKTHIQNINLMAYTNKQRTVETQIRVVLIYVLFLLLVVILYSLLFYFKP